MKAKLVVLLVLIAALLLGAVPALAASGDEAVFTVSTVEDAHRGSDVDVSITITQNPGLAGATLEVTYDNAALTPKSVTFGSGLGGITDRKLDYAENKISLVWGGTSDVTGTQLYATITFTVKDDAASGSHPITANYKDGNVKNVGNAKKEPVTCEFVDGGVNVTVPVTGVTLDQQEIKDLHPGQTRKLTATVQPTGATNQKVTFSSDTTGVATVNAEDGTVTAVAPGQATITATTADGSRTATCKVTVVAHDFSGNWQTDDNQHWHVCSCGATDTKSDHKWVEKTDREPTEDVAGQKHEECSVCGKQKEPTEIPKLTHDPKFHPEVKATCVSKGNVAYYSCANCGKNYKEDTCETVLETVETNIDPENHTGKTELKGKKDATCTEDGYSGDTYCADCHVELEKGKTVPALGHDIQKVEAKEATHAADGCKEHYSCTRCGKVYKDANGEEELKAEDVTVPKIAHAFSDEWKSDDKNHWHECECGEKDAVAAHTYGDWKVTKEATNEAEGEKTRVCTVCGYAETQTIPVLSESAKTGDTMPLILCAVLLAVSATGIAVLTIQKKRIG